YEEVAKVRKRGVPDGRVREGSPKSPPSGVPSAGLPAEPGDDERERDEDDGAQDARRAGEQSERAAREPGEDETDDGEHRRSAADHAARPRREPEHSRERSDDSAGAARAGPPAGQPSLLAAIKQERKIGADQERHRDRKSTRLNSSHQITSYAVVCLKKKTTR